MKSDREETVVMPDRHCFSLALTTDRSRLSVKSHLGDMQWVEGSFPTPHGVVKVRHERLPNGEIDSEIDAPEAIKIIH